jgi:hypothetical protein
VSDATIRKSSANKFLITLLSVILIVLIGLGATMAFLVDTDLNTNRLKMQDLDLVLYQPSYPGDAPVTIKPGYFVKIDPTVKLVSGTGYLRIVIEFLENNESAEAYKQPITDTQRISAIWKTLFFYEENALSSAADLKQTETALAAASHFNETAFEADYTRGDETHFVFNYILHDGKFEAGDSVVFFNAFIAPSDWNQDHLTLLGKYSVSITAQVIQYDGFSSADDAYSALSLAADNNEMAIDYKTVTIITSSQP